MGGGVSKKEKFGLTIGALERKVALPLTIRGESITIGKSVGAAALNYTIKDPASNKTYKFYGGTKITNVQVFAGKGVRNKLRPEVAAAMARKYGGKPTDWQHAKGLGTVERDGRLRTVEVHWFQAKNRGMHEFKIKDWLS